jgi:hypothetical protein
LQLAAFLQNLHRQRRAVARHGEKGDLCLRRSFVVILTVLMLLPLAGQNPVVAATGFQVVVHPDVEGTRIPRSALSSIFLKEAPRWADGELVQPVDQSMRSEVRAVFCQEVLDVSVDELKRLWHQKILAGVMPPPVKASDEEILAYVAEKKGAIGYVSVDTPLPEGVKTVSIID